MAEQETRNSPSLGGQGNGGIGGGGGGEDMKEDVNAPINIKVSWCGLVYFEWSFLLFSFLFYCFSSFTYSYIIYLFMSGRDISRRRNVFQNQEEHQAE